ncbi:MAG: Transferase [uncultured Sulfurovum sp.]|uniref:Transferase n=1 Tax=uncultured Sulfurovum sp. TaxID=269237 RepID=A0A6S6S320_9BACT|nr:MAG: Transferase [uncultured Sulfurovum sp.]
MNDGCKMQLDKPKRLVGLIHALDVGGAERMMITILNYFLSENFEVHLIIFDNRGALKDDLNENIIVHDLLTPSVMKGMPKCLQQLKIIKADIIFTGIGHLNIALAPFVSLMRLFLPQSKWIARETNIVSLQNQSSKYPKVFDFLYKHTYSNYDVIIAQSEDMKEDLAENYSIVEKVFVINNPIDHERVTELSKSVTPFSFDKNKVNLLTVARLREEKRHDLMLKALALLSDKYHLTIVGAGEKEASLKELSKSLNLEKRVTFEGQQSNPYTYIKEADLFLLTSQREGFPNVLLEANVLGLPIVAFACKGGITEIIEEGVNGRYCDFEDIECLAKKIDEASMDNSFNEEVIIKRTIEKYSKDSILNSYKNIFYNSQLTKG